MSDLTKLAGRPRLGVGLAYSRSIVGDIFANDCGIDFVEIIVEHYLEDHPANEAALRRLSERFPVVCHGIDLSVGTAEPLDETSLRRKAQVVADCGAPWFSDHLCFTKAHGIDLGQLTPLPFTDESVEVVVRNIRTVKAWIPVPLLLENITYYFSIPGSTMSEAEFITRVLEASDCGLLLDLTNVHTNAVNHGYDPFEFLRALPLERVVEVHVAGGSGMNGVLIDSHSTPVPELVWDLLRFVVPQAPIKGVVLERDEDVPALDELCRELEVARGILAGRADGSTSFPGAGTAVSTRLDN